MAKLVRPENYKNRVLLTPDLSEHVAYIQHFIDLGFNEIYVHNVARNQEAFIEAYGKNVIPNLQWKSQEDRLPTLGNPHPALRATLSSVGEKVPGPRPPSPSSRERGRG
jgi:hypothetical protein